MSLVCGNCGEQLLNTENCPSCGQRKFMEIFEDNIKVGESIKVKAYKGGESKRKGLKFEFIQGWDFSKSRGYYIDKYREVNRENNFYIERVVDPITGEVIKNHEGLLSDHIGHGSARKSIK
ncbi:hypothetical protein [Acinetobacter sp.]|jgi:hypothetical protein|uniref:hypothetical protein n=1 Tax=Acinetobacter sp. TaxID=472 RepID=UPI00289C69ED|nr:hypothetical protein [Acinetobacter sp.]